MRGRKPQPTKLKILRGNPGQRRLNEQEPQHVDGKLTCPAWMPAAGRARWRELVALLVPIGLLKPAHRDALVAYCTAWAELRYATMTLAKEGHTVKTRFGVGHHPAVAMQRSAWKAIKDFSTLFGLDPSSQSRIKVCDNKPADDLAEFLPHAASS
jgi:P27 family predicted phage terminase small subunit